MIKTIMRNYLIGIYAHSGHTRVSFVEPAGAFVVVFVTLSTCSAQCTYADINNELYTCFTREGFYTEYAFPFMNETEAASWCSNVTIINDCVSQVISACSSVNNVTRFFGSSGSYLTSAYTYICNQFNSLTPEPFQCSTGVIDANIKANLTSFDDVVDAEASPTTTFICSAASDMQTQFQIELDRGCSNLGSYPNSKSVWLQFFTRMTQACSAGSRLHVTDAILVLATLMLALYSLQ